MMRKFLAFLLLTLMCVGGWADNVGPFTFTNWVYNSYTRVGGTEGSATYVCNAPIYMEQKGVTIANAGDLTISFQYTNGGKRLEIYGVELIGSESSYTAFEHKFAGSNGAQTYTLSGVAAGTYTLRIWSSEYGDGNSYLLGGATNGNITYSGDAANGANLTITSWSKDNWKKSGAAIPTQVSSTIKQKGWRSYNNIHYYDDASLNFTEAKTYNINYNYTGADGGGNERMDIRGVEILDGSNNVVACDYHEGFTGNAASNRDYKLEVPAGTYTVRTLVQTANANDVRCKGNVTYSVIDGSAIATNYTTNIKPNLYDNGVLKIGAPVQSYLTALETAIEGGNDLTIEAAYNAAMTTNNLNLPSGYYYMKNMDMTSGNNVAAAPYAYNDYNFNGNTSHKTLMTATTGANNTIWKIENNGATVSVLNGDGKGINNGTAYTTLNFGNFKATQFIDWGAKGIYFTQGLHASNQSRLQINGVVALTSWPHDDSQGSAWEFIPAENPNIYNVVVRGADAYVTLNNTNEYAFNGGFFNAESINKEDLTAQNVDGLSSKIEVSGNTITVTYVANHPYLVFKCERGGIVANANGNLTTAAFDASADNQKFLLVNIEDKDYLYSPTLQKFVTSPASGNVFTLVNYPHHAYTTADAANPSGDYTTILKINNQYMNNNGNGSMVNGWNSEDGGNRYQINEVGGISDEEYTTLVADIKALCDTKKSDMKTANDAYSTTALGAYHWENLTATTEAVSASQALNTEAENYYTSLFAEIRKFDIAYQPTLNMPQDGTFLRMKSKVNGNYITINPNHNTGTSLQTIATASADNIFRYTGGKLLVYTTGMYVNNNNHAHPNYSSAVTFSEATATGTKGVYAIKSGSKNHWYDSGAGNNISNYENAAHANCEWILEEVPYMYAVTINGGDENACVQTSDNVQVKKGGYLYVADGTAEVTYTPAADGYVANYEQDDETKTITVTYTEEAAPVELTSGYYYIKNKASNKYLVNNYDFSTTTTLSGSNVRTNNGVWKVDVNDNKTITLKNGIATPLYVGETSYSKLSFVGDPVTSGVYFTEKIDGSSAALAIGSEEAAATAATTWVFEPITSTDKIVDVIINGDNGEGVVTYNGNQKAINGGFFRFDGSAVLSAENYSLSEVAGKESSKICRLNNEPYYVDAEYFVYNETAKGELQALIDEIYPNVMSNEIGYPKYNSVIYDSDETSKAWGEIMIAYYDRDQIANANKGQFIAYLIDARTVANCADINLPTPGGFYTLTNGEGTKTYYFKEGNDGLSQLLCYGGTENGQFAQISEDFSSVAYNGIDNTSGEEFNFMAARTNDKGMPVNFGKVCVWQSGEGPLPSGDGNIYSGWTIRKTQPSAKMNPIGGAYYASIYMPTAVQLPANVEAYVAKINEDGTRLKLTQIDLGSDHVLAANTPVVLISGTEISTAALPVSNKIGVGEEDNDLEGTITTMSQVSGYTYYVLNKYEEVAGFYKYKSTSPVNGFKAYYREFGTQSPGFSFAITDDLTGLEDAIEEVVNEKFPLYDLQGNKIVNPVKGNIYIQNGKAFKY